ncbi:DUF5008 domain-containing protein [Chitinophaga solisilvae]|uniref:DUF5008 domain-containing protein n=1 Tax=Chitinophaga solisilvae TaxID=1233460 RepID=UPI0013688A6A|nr:DUF5008 domain-containing protein [Chitinophaga solisilvae]
MLKNTIGLLLLSCIITAGCNKKEDVYPDPYAGAKKNAPVQFSDELPTPQRGSAGDQVTFKVTGLLPFKGTARFYMSGKEAQIISITDKTVTVKVPDGASSGSGWINIGNDVYPASLFRVNGKVKLDNTFRAGTGADGMVLGIVPTSDSRYLITGNFKLYNSNGVGNPLNGIALIERHGQYVDAFRTDSAVYRFGSISTAVQLPDNKFLIGGQFDRYGRMKGINGITRIHTAGMIDTTTVRIVPEQLGETDPHAGGPTEEERATDTVPAFNGGVTGVISKLFYTGNRVIAIGSFFYYVQYYYANSTKSTRSIDLRRVNNIVAMDVNGNLDSSYHYNLATHQGEGGPQGGLTDGVVLPGGRLLLVGKFNKFDNTAAGSIVCLDANGRIDPSFNAGTGATDGAIASVTYNPVTRKIMLTGTFTTFNGVAGNGLAMLNEDGSMVSTFKARTVGGGSPIYALQMKSGLIAVAGTFNQYDNYTREGLMILQPDGSLAAGYNNTGRLQGLVFQMQETTSAEGDPAILITGTVSSFDNTAVGNIFRIVIEK